jgi:serine/threonine protein phosphatase PrpC
MNQPCALSSILTYGVSSLPLFPPRLQDVSGSTAITALVTADKFHVANCGDSRAVLARGGGVFWGSEDHKPNDPEERGRIEKAGGTVSCKRVDGDLAVSRSLGDFSYKQSSSLPAEEQKVSADPVVTPLERNAAEDEFLILACDGIWDVMTNESCAAWIRDRLQQESDLGRVCEALLDHCLGLNSRDNMSVAIVVFPACKVAATGVHFEEGKTDSSA